MASAWAGSIWLRPRVASGSPARSTRTPVSFAGSGASAETSRTSSPSTTISPSGSARTNSDRSGFGASFPRGARDAAARLFGAGARRELSVRSLAFGDSKRPLPFDARTGNVSDSMRPLSAVARASDGARMGNVSDSTRPPSADARASDGAPSLICARTGNVSDSMRPLSAVARSSDGARMGNVSDSTRPLSVVARSSDGAPSLICARTENASDSTRPLSTAARSSDGAQSLICVRTENASDSMRPLSAAARSSDGAQSLICVRTEDVSDSTRPLSTDARASDGARTENVSDSTCLLSADARASDGARTENVSDSTCLLSADARASDGARTGNVSDSMRPLSAVARASDGGSSLTCARTGNGSNSTRPLSAVARASDGAPSLICARTENGSDSTRLLSTDARTSGRETFRAQVSSPFRVKRARKCPSPSMRCGHRRRQPSCDAPTPGSSKASGSKSGCARRNSRTVPSFSSRLNVHVEYTSFPPGRTMRAASFRIAVCRAAQPAGASGFHWDAASGSRRNMPSPEQGASTSTRSKNAGRTRASASAGAEVTNAFVTPSRSRFPSRMRARENSISLESRKPRPFSRAAICPLLPPGAAHRSSTRSPGRGSSAATGAIADASCR